MREDQTDGKLVEKLLERKTCKVLIKALKATCEQSLHAGYTRFNELTCVLAARVERAYV